MSTHDGNNDEDDDGFMKVSLLRCLFVQSRQNSTPMSAAHIGLASLSASPRQRYRHRHITHTINNLTPQVSF